MLLIAWRRPHTTKQVLDAIRLVAPTRMFIACDGANPDRAGEAEQVAATRELIAQEIDWPCSVATLYAQRNVGCRQGVSQAISWFFEQVEEGIILEDDCVPHPDFFSYCAELLERYREDKRIFSVCGSNFQLGNQRGEASYYFSIHGDSWGWATWRRAWAFYADAQTHWATFRDTERLSDVFIEPQERLYWRTILDDLCLYGRPSTWDYQWWLASWMNHGLHAWPNSSLISNVGWDDEGTHTFGSSVFSNLPVEELGPIRHPLFVLPDRQADAHAFLNRRGGKAMVEQARYGNLYPWRLRWLNLKKLGLRRYLMHKLNPQAQRETTSSTPD